MNNEDMMLESLLRIHKKLDNQAEHISEIKVAQARLPCNVISEKVKKLEKVVYTACAIILIGFVVALSGNNPPDVKAQVNPKNTSVIMKAIKDNRK